MVQRPLSMLCEFLSLLCFEESTRVKICQDDFLYLFSRTWTVQQPLSMEVCMSQQMSTKLFPRAPVPSPHSSGSVVPPKPPTPHPPNRNGGGTGAQMGLFHCFDPLPLGESGPRTWGDLRPADPEDPTTRGCGRVWTGAPNKYPP